MTINISDVVVNIGQQVSNSEWLEFLKILLPVVIGGYITYKASEKVKYNETQQDNIKKFALLSQITNFCFSVLRLINYNFVFHYFSSIIALI